MPELLWTERLQEGAEHRVHFHLRRLKDNEYATLHTYTGSHPESVKDLTLPAAVFPQYESNPKTLAFWLPSAHYFFLNLELWLSGILHFSPWKQKREVLTHLVAGRRELFDWLTSSEFQQCHKVDWVLLGGWSAPRAAGICLCLNTVRPSWHWLPWSSSKRPFCQVSLRCQLRSCPKIWLCYFSRSQAQVTEDTARKPTGGYTQSSTRNEISHHYSAARVIV